MRRSALLGFGIAAAALSGCGVAASVPPVSATAAKVNVVKSDPPAGAQLIGPVEGTHGSGCGMYGRKGTFEGALATLREEAARKGANYVTLVMVTEPHSENGCFDQEFRVRGMAYKTGTPPVVQAGPAVASSTCDPPCSPGYSCSAGTCLAVCNPQCGPTQTCSQERVCVDGSQVGSPATNEPQAEPPPRFPTASPASPDT
jgi:hypothetical protein